MHVGNLLTFFSDHSVLVTHWGVNARIPWLRAEQRLDCILCTLVEMFFFFCLWASSEKWGAVKISAWYRVRLAVERTLWVVFATSPLSQSIDQSTGMCKKNKTPSSGCFVDTNLASLKIFRCFSLGETLKWTFNAISFCFDKENKDSA